ncbi:putative disease resistance protein RGA3 [Pistacia vera]|uniref:putative disease resistance protein RGA3 n=1 Tax=Pistacia vera TaxID=55513 RepID=UPI001263B63D|nr:putative disease resistance protein RGA3 [Pistacia vera]
MAEGILFDVARKIIEQLGSLAVHEIGLAWSVKNDITQLKDRVRTIQGILLDAEEQHNKKNNEVTAWLQTLKDAFYDADDLLDYYYTEFQQRKVMAGNKMAKKVRIFFSKSNQIAFSLKMAHKMKKTVETLKNIYSVRPGYLNQRFIDEKRVVNLERESHSFVPIGQVIGRGDEKNNVIQLLLDSNDDENVSIISIYGFGGLGKTTLAQLVYNDENITKCLQLRMWVCVSDEFNVKLIVEKIIKSITHKEPGNLELDQLQKRFREEIEDKRYLLVLDDVWNENPNTWDQLKNLLLNGARGSKILVTTHSEQVAKITSKHSFHIHPLRELAKDKSWSLFKQIAFEHGIEPKDSKLVEIGKEIVAKCGGVPLVIKTIGNLLYGNNKEDDWLQFKDNKMSKIIQKESDILPILKLNNDHLPSHLKQCFAYCAQFPKDCEIEKQKLIHLWMAQGFLQGSNKKECPEDISNKYFMALLLRSFFQDLKYDEWGNIIACKMHDVMHDLAQLVAGIECKMVALDTFETVDGKCRYLSLDCGEISGSWKFPTALYSAKNARTLLLLDKLKWEIKVDDGYKILTSYRHLQTLDFGGIRFQKLFTWNGELDSSIAKLEHLRYLNLSKMDIKSFPNSILRLWNLETLDLSYCKKLIKLPSDISKMVNLRHLIIKGCDFLLGMPHGLGLLTNLQTLSLFVASKRIRKSKHSGIDELNRLNNLSGDLEIKILKYIENGSLANLNDKQFLQSLILHWGRSRHGEVEGIDEVMLEGLKPHPNLKKISIKSFMGVKFCNWFSSLTNLTSISIERCGHCQSVPPLNKLPHLKSLSLQFLSGLEYISEEANLESLPVAGMRNLTSLAGLKIILCSRLTQVHNGIRFLTSLQNLRIERCDKLDFLTDDVQWQSLQSLYSLQLFNLPKLVSLPKGFQYLTSLQKLIIGSCKQYESPSSEDDDDMPWQGFRSLWSLKIHGLPKLVSLPKGLQYVATLRDLYIAGCDQFGSLNSEDDDDMPWQGFRSL